MSVSTPYQDNGAQWSIPARARLWSDPGTVLQVVAHADDDLYFINPDLQRAIDAGATVVTLVLTAGEGDGRNLDSNYRDRNKTKPDFAGYSAARQNGLRRAYARMATGDPAAPWHREVLWATDRVALECDTLLANQRVRLCFLQIAHGVTGQEKGARGLRHLWQGEVPASATLPVPGSPLSQEQWLGRDDVTAVVVSLLNDYRPTVVRTLDPDPEHDGGKEEYVSSDHHEHSVAARIALDAVARHRAMTGGAPVVEYYRACANRYWPTNLSHPEAAAKASLLQTYAGADGIPDPERNLGDFQLGVNPYRSTHLLSTAYRYASNTSWLVRQADGALAAFAVLGGQVVRWLEHPESGHWQGPELLDGPGWFTPGLASVVGPDGRLHLVALRRYEDGSGQSVVDLVHRVQDAPGLPFGPWVSLGNPDADHQDRRRQCELGVPAAAADSDGRLHVFARNYDQGLAHVEEWPGHGWSAWGSLGGDFLQDSPYALTTASGRIEVYVPGKQTVRRWYQQEPQGEFVKDFSLSTLPPATGGVTAVESEPDRIALYFRQAGTAQVMAYRQAGPLGGWPSRPAGFGGHDGTGPIAVLPVPGRGAGDALMAHRNAVGTVAVSTPPEKDTRGPRLPAWTDLSGAVLQAPSAYVDAAGRAVLAVIGTDGRLHIARQVAVGPSARFGPWSAI